MSKKRSADEMESSTQMKCGVCFESYTPDGKHIPMSFSCGHTYCFDCVQKIENQRRGVTCPACRAKSVPAKNILAVTMLEQLHQCSVVHHSASSSDTVFFHESKRARLLPVWDDAEMFQEVLAYARREDSIRDILSERFTSEDEATYDHGLRILKENTSLDIKAAVEGRIADKLTSDSVKEPNKNMELGSFLKSSPVVPAFVLELIAAEFRKRQQFASMTSRVMKVDFEWQSDDNFDVLCQVAEYALDFDPICFALVKPIPFNFHDNFVGMMNYIWSKPQARMNLMRNVLSVIQKDVSSLGYCSDRVPLFLNRLSRYGETNPGDECNFQNCRESNFIGLLESILREEAGKALAAGVVCQPPAVVKRCLLVYNFCTRTSPEFSSSLKVLHKVSGIGNRCKTLFFTLTQAFKGLHKLCLRIVTDLCENLGVTLMSISETMALWDAFSFNVKQDFETYGNVSGNDYFHAFISCFYVHTKLSPYHDREPKNEYIMENGLLKTLSMIAKDDEVSSWRREQLNTCFGAMIEASDIDDEITDDEVRNISKFLKSE